MHNLSCYWLFRAEYLMLFSSFEKPIKNQFQCLNRSGIGMNEISTF